MALRHLFAAAALLAVAAPGHTEPTKVGQYMVDNQYRLINGQQLSGYDLRGQVVVVNFWARDCQACDEQLKVLDYYYRQRENVGLVMMVSSIDRINRSDFRAALSGMRIHGIRDFRGSLEPTMAVPATYIIDRTGKVRYAAAGALDIAALNRLLVPLLREPQPQVM